MQAIQELRELAEKERCAGNRQKFLKLQEQIEEKEQEAVQERHKQYLENVKKDFPVGRFIPEIHATIKDIKDGCGTQAGWVEIYLLGIEKSLSPGELRGKIQDAKNKKSAPDYFDTLKLSDKSKSLCIGNAYSETIDMLINVMSLDLPMGEEAKESFMDYPSESYNYVLKQAKEDGYTDEQAEEKAMEAEDKERSEEFEKYQQSIVRTLNYLLNFHDIELEEKGKKYYLVTQKSWKEVADKVATTITGHGMFEYNSGKELKEGLSCKTYCEAAIQHLHWLKHYTEVYGERSYRSVYER